MQCVYKNALFYIQSWSELIALPISSFQLSDQSDAEGVCKIALVTLLSKGRQDSQLVTQIWKDRDHCKLNSSQATLSLKKTGKHQTSSKV